MPNHDIPAKITDITALSPGDKVMLIEFDGDMPRDITHATVHSITDATFTLHHVNDEPLGNVVRGNIIHTDTVEYFTALGPHGAVRVKGARPNIYAHRGTYLYDPHHPLAQYLFSWADFCIEAHALQTTLTESAIAIRLHNGEADIDDLYEIREYADKIVAGKKNADAIGQELDRRAAEYY